MTRKRYKKTTGNGATMISVKPPPPAPNTLAVQVTVPLAWSVLLPTSLALVTVLAALMVRSAARVDWDWWMAPLAGAVVWTVVFAWRVAVCERDRRRLFLYPLEMAMGVDLDQDGHVGAPVEGETEVEVEDEAHLIYVHNAYRAEQRRGAQEFRHFLKLAYDGRGTTWREWEDVSLPSGRRVTRPLWEMWTGRLVQAGLARREYPTAPLELMGAYREALGSLREVL